MQCQFCSNEATRFFTQVVGKKLNKVCLCEACSKDSELMKENGLPSFLTEEVPSTPEGSADTEPSGTGGAPEVVCATCALTLSEHSNTGRLGCSDCYEAFSDFLDERIRVLHRGRHHEGKVIEVVVTKSALEKDISKMKEELGNAVKGEEFEKAATLRDLLAALESQLISL